MNIFKKIINNRQKQISNILDSKYFILKYKNENVALLEKNINEFVIKKIYNRNLLPFNVIDPGLEKYCNDDLVFAHSSQLKANFAEWLESRQMPHERPNLSQLLEKYNIKNKSNLATLTLNLSLFDQYWTCPENLNLNWDDINFFKNGFSSDIGDILFDPERKKLNIDFISADSTTSGMDPKRWILDKNNNAFLIKTHLNNEQIQANEAIASLICDKLNINHIKYGLMREDLILNYNGLLRKNNLFSISKCLCDENHTMIHANMIAINNGHKSRSNIIDFFKQNEELQKDFDKMLILDYIMVQEDRNYNNYGIIINNETGEKQFFFLDNANSLCYENNNSKNIIEQISDRSKVYRTHTEAIKYIDDFSIVNLNKIKNIDEEILEILNKTNLDEFQKANIIKLINHRTLQLEELIKNIEIERNTLKNKYVEIIEEYKNTGILKENPKWQIENGKLKLNPSAELEYIKLRLLHKVSNENEYVNYKINTLEENSYEK